MTLADCLGLSKLPASIKGAIKQRARQLIDAGGVTDVEAGKRAVAYFHDAAVESRNAIAKALNSPAPSGAGKTATGKPVTGLDEKANAALDEAFKGLFAAEPVKHQPAVQFRGATFTGETHDAAIEKLGERFPRYKETSRKAEPIVRGYKTPEGDFKGLMDIARQARVATDATNQATWLEKQASQRGRTIASLAVNKPEVFTKLAVEWRNDHPIGAAETTKLVGDAGLVKPGAYEIPGRGTHITAADPEHGGNMSFPVGSTLPEIQAIKAAKAKEFAATDREQLSAAQSESAKAAQAVYDRIEPLGAADPNAQLAVPPEKLGGMVAAAQEMIRLKIDTPEKLADVLESKFGGKARAYSQAFWDAIGMVNPQLRGTHDWMSIYSASSEKEKVDMRVRTPAENLTRAIRNKLITGQSIDRRTLTQLAGDLPAKEADEAAELAVVQAAREITGKSGTPEEKFDQLVSLYERQPNLTAKTSTSKVNQAYSTPAPLAFLAGHLAGLETANSAYEPTAGNGMLTIAGNPKIFHVNEMDPARAANLAGAGFASVSEKDALTSRPFKAPVDAIVENPPFGTILHEGGSMEFPLAGTGETTKNIDQAIALHTLESLADDGRAVLLLGGKNFTDPEARAKAYATPNQMAFWKPLYEQYRVVDQFTVNGDLYSKQGAGWPVDVVVIAGKGKSPIMLPSADAPRILNTWNELRAELGRTDQQRIAAGRYDPERDRAKISGVISAIEGIARPEQRTGSADDTKPTDQGNVRGGSGGSVATGVREPSEPAARPKERVESRAEREGRVGDGRSDVQPEQRGSLGFRVPYKPVSKLPSFNVFVPTSLEVPIRESLERLVAKVGPLDQYIRSKLGYRADAPLERYFSGEQIDAMAQAIDAIESGVAAVNGDQGGIGKGRAAAGLMAYAIKQGKTPIFVTKDVKLYAAMIEDLHDIGRDDIIPMFTDNGLSFEDYADKKWEQGRMVPTMQEIARTGKLPADTHALFTTYAQIQTDQPPGYKASPAERAAMQHKHQPPPDGPRMAALKRLAPNSIIIADESHLASGDSIRAWRLHPLLSAAYGTAYSSATFAKRPDSMGIYSRTSLSHATNNMGELIDAMKQGGVPLQQVVTGTLAGDGLYMRRERDFSKAVFRTHINVDTKDRDTRLADNYTDGLRTILGISNQMQDAIRELNKVLRRDGKNMQLDNPPRVESTNFAAKIHNLVSQYLFAIKAESVIRRTVEGVTKGFTNAEGKTVPHKVIITFQNTMEQPMVDLKRGGRPLTFTGMLLKYLDTQRVLKSGKKPNQQKIEITDTPDPQFAQYSDKQLRDRMIVPHPTDPDAQAGVNEAALAELFRRIMSGVFKVAEEKIGGLDLADMPLSPIDHIRQELTKAGIKNAEITGRSIGLDADGKLYQIHPSTHTKKAHLRTLSAFNNSDTDALLMNASGSTGISAHSSAKFKRPDPRGMLVVQLNLDINDQIQTFYRTDRTGQLHQPYYELVQTALPAELRPAAIFGRKMASLNANTTSNAENEISEGNKGVDIFNQYGDETVWNYLKSNREFLHMLDMPRIMDGPKLLPLADIVADLEDGQFAGKVTGRVAVLPSAEGKVFWDKVMADYEAKIDYLNEIGENDLVADTVDLKAETLESKELTPSKSGQGRPSGFDAASYLEKIKADIGKKPLTGDEVVKMMNDLGEKAHAIHTDWTAKVRHWQAQELEKLSKNVLWNPEKQQAYVDRWREQEEEISASIGLIGSGLHIKTEKGTDGYGAITSVKFDDHDPLVPSKQKFDIHINTTKQELRIPASQLPTVARLAVGDFKDIYEATAERSNERYMVTGNLLSAYLAIQSSAPTAKVVQYTTDKGDVRQGIMMPMRFMPSMLAKKLNVESGSHMRELLEAGRSLTNAGGEVTIVKAPDGAYVLRVPSSRTMGGTYWRDSRLASLMDGNQFIERGGAMIGKFDGHMSEAVYQRLLDLNASLFYTEQPDIPTKLDEPLGAAVPTTVEEFKKKFAPGLDILTDIKKGVQSLLLPSAQSPEHLAMAEDLGSKLGPMHRRQEAARKQINPSWLQFEKMGVHREDVSLVKNPGIQFMSDVSMGKPTKLQAVADLYKKMFEGRVALAERAGAPLSAVRENYFPGMWTRESRMAFNQAFNEAIVSGAIPEEADIEKLDNSAEQAQVRERAIELLNEGAGSETDALMYLTRRPLKGQESFRKPKVFDDIMSAVRWGLIPISNNPADLVMLKLAELDKSIMGNELFQSRKAKGRLKVITPYEKVPDDWTKLPDKHGTIYGPPTVKEEEYVDKNIYDGLMASARAIGIEPERLFKSKRGSLGYASTSGKTVSQFATELSVLAHEIGHQLDFKYDLYSLIVKNAVGLGLRGTQTKGASQVKRGVLGKELRALADLSWEGRDPAQLSDYYKAQVRSRDEKMAHMLEAYVHAREKFKEVAPTVFQEFDKFIKEHPETAPLADIKPGISLERLTNERYVGLPILGYRIVPKPDGEILNNYLSSSLYNNRYFGTLYTGWMSIANVLNQTQLGVGSAFHAGFTTIEAQVSAGANVVKDIYGLLRGNRSFSDLLNTTKHLGTATVETAMTGDKVLNAYRNPDGVIDPRIAQVVRATELAGGGFRLERGLKTDQSSKFISDWLNGHRLRAARRSPVAFVEMLAKPIMEVLVPRQKAGVFAHLVWRIIEQNPGKSLEDLTSQFRQAWNRVDARLGQVRYDRLFINNTAKNVVQGLVRAPGWSGGTIAELGGAFKDTYKFFEEWARTGKLPQDLPDRVAYTISLLVGIALINALLTYLFTGTAPEGLDYFAFRTGGKDEHGNPERFMLPSYVKDLIAYEKEPVTTLLNKSHPLLSVFADLYRNKNYYGVEIRDTDANKLQQLISAGASVAKAFIPFWIRGAQKTIMQGGVTPKALLPLIGVMPAPRRITQTPAQEMADKINQSTMPAAPLTERQAERRQEKSTTVSNIRRGIAPNFSSSLARGTLKPSDIPAIYRRASMAPIAAQVDHMTLENAEKVYQRASLKERDQLAAVMARKRINSLARTHSKFEGF